MTNIMREQWDHIAAENAFFGVVSRDEFESPEAVDLDRFWKTGRQDVDSLLTLVGVEATQPLVALEIGCGLGRMTHRFAERFAFVYALDVSPAMLEEAGRHWGHLENVEWVLGSGEDLGRMADAQVDWIFSFWVLQHIPRAEVALNYVRETGRVLKVGGRAFLQFRIIPPGWNLPAVKYQVLSRWPVAVQNALRVAWDRMNGFEGRRAEFARKYESWRGCALRPAAIEKVAAKAALTVLRTGSLGVQSPGTHSGYYLFEKTAAAATAGPP
jgi:SAM-dependent methyltransferase